MLQIVYNWREFGYWKCLSSESLANSNPQLEYHWASVNWTEEKSLKSPYNFEELEELSHRNGISEL